MDSYGYEDKLLFRFLDCDISHLGSIPQSCDCAKLVYCGSRSGLRSVLAPKPIDA